MYFVSCVLSTLFHTVIDVVKSTVQVYNSQGYSIKFPPAVIRIQLGSLGPVVNNNFCTCDYAVGGCWCDF